jgi:hypothetical protein
VKLEVRIGKTEIGKAKAREEGRINAECAETREKGEPAP